MSMRKRYVSISEIQKRRSGVIITLDGREYEVTTDFFTSGYYYPGKELDDSEVSAIMKASHLFEADNYLNKLLSKRRYTRKELSDRLREKFDLSSSDIDLLLSSYVASGAISDMSYARDYLFDRSSRGYGIRDIRENLRVKGVSLELVSEEEIREAQAEALEVIKPMLAMRDPYDKPLRARRQNLQRFLEHRGFEPEVIRSLIDEYFSSMTDEEKKMADQEREKKLEAILERHHSKISATEDDERVIMNKLIKRLSSQGYSYEEIRAAIKQKGYEI